LLKDIRKSNVTTCITRRILSLSKLSKDHTFTEN